MTKERLTSMYKHSNSYISTKCVLMTKYFMKTINYIKSIFTIEILRES